MGKNSKKIFSFILALTILFDVVVFAKKTFFKDDLININELSEEFMDNYFEEVSNVKEEDKENMLIITSKKKLEDTYGASKIIEAPNHQYFLQYDSEEEKNDALEKFNSDNSDIDVSENLIRTIDEDTVLVSSYNSWGVEAMGIDTLLEKLENKELNDVVVAIIDTGLDVDLFNKYYPGRLAGTYNVLENNNEMYDNNGHGTHVAGTVAETTPVSVKILPVKIADVDTMYTSDIISAINYVTYGKKADVMNMSYGGYGYSQGEYNAVAAAKQEKIISVAAAGNDNLSKTHYPSGFDNTISISSVTSAKVKSSFSNYGDTIMFAAPGSDIKSIMGKNAQHSKNEDGDDDHEIISGTSMATPHVSGVVATFKCLNDELVFDDVIKILRRYSNDLGDIGWDEYYGNGFIEMTDAQICDGEDCDEYNVFKSSSRDNLDDVLKSYEIEPTLTGYNYGTINNILNTKVKIEYTNGKTVEYRLYNIKSLELSGYDPYGNGEQTVNIKIKTPLGIEIEDTFTVTNPETYNSAWNYEFVGNNEIELTGYKDPHLESNVLYIPSIIDGYTVTGIADDDDSIFDTRWNDSFINVQYLYLPSTLTKIGNHAFNNSNLGLYNNKKSKLTYVKSDAESLYVGDYAFGELESLSELDANISYIGDYAFKNAKNLHEIQLSDDITHIGEGSFEGALDNASIVIPPTVIQIGNRAFYNSSLKEIVFMNSIETIPEEMFYNNTILEKVILPEGIKEIGANAFAECKKLKTINLPESLITIGNRAFYNAFYKTTLTIPKNVTSIGANILSGSGLKEIIFNNSMEELPVEIMSTNRSLEKVTLPEGIKKIGAGAFVGCNKLEIINLPESLTTIGEEAFLQAFDRDKNVILEIPSNVVNIGEQAFLESGLKEINILGNINALPDNVFRDNFYLEKVTLPEGIKEIGEKTFDGCNKLKIINFPESLTTIGKFAFSNAFDSSADVKLEIPSNVTIFGYGVFQASGIKEVNILSNIENVPDSMFFGSSNLEKVTLPESVKEIDNNVFRECIALKTINIPKSVKHIGDYSFYNCKLETLNLPEGLTTIGDSTFSGCDKLSLINLPKSVTTIGEDAFRNIDSTAKFYVYSNSVPKTYAHDNNINYVQIDPDAVSVQGVNSQYHAFDTIDMSNVSLELTYNEESVRTETITENIEIEYPDSRENLRYGDTSVKIIAYNEMGYKIEKNVSIEVLKLQPEYTVPTGLSVNKGQKLSQIELPAGFEWMNGNQVINESGVYKARFVPTDSINYETVENIDITITVNENSTSPYVVNNYTVDQDNLIISNITPNTELNSFTSNIILGYGYGIDVDSKEVNGKQVLYTGAKVRITHGLDLYKEYTVSVIGDINGDGDISVSDVSMIYKNLKRKNEFDSAQSIASDVNGDEGISVSDISMIYKHIKKKINLGG